MESYYDFNRIVGEFSKLAGILTTVYGIVNKDWERIAGGVALAYCGRTMTEVCDNFDSNVIQKERNRIIRDKPTLDTHVE